MRAAFKKFVTAARAGDALNFGFSGCEWCHQLWPKSDDDALEQVEERARQHVYTCASHPLKIERDALREMLAEAIDLNFTTPEQRAAGFNPEARLHALKEQAGLATGREPGKSDRRNVGRRVSDKTAARLRSRP